MKRRFRLMPVLLVIAIAIVLICAFALKDPAPDGTAAGGGKATEIAPEGTPLEAPPAPSAGEAPELQVVVFDVGQADCILLMTGTHSMLIDAGNIGQGQIILDYLASCGIQRLDYIIATHPHADHIGSMKAVITGMESVGAVIMPDVIHNTKTFEAMLDAIEEKDIPLVIANPGDSIALDGAQIQVLAPAGGKYTTLNDYSVVLRVTFGQTSFLLTGDADKKSEDEQLASGLPLKADVLKVGHHGSRTSSAQKYLDAVAPKYAVISLGADNHYGHPHKETMERLAGMDLEIYRTDENGTVTFIADGETIAVNVERGST